MAGGGNFPTYLKIQSAIALLEDHPQRQARGFGSLWGPHRATVRCTEGAWRGGPAPATRRGGAENPAPQAKRGGDATPHPPPPGPAPLQSSSSASAAAGSDVRNTPGTILPRGRNWRRGPALMRHQSAPTQEVTTLVARAGRCFSSRSGTGGGGGGAGVSGRRLTQALGTGGRHAPRQPPG